MGLALFLFTWLAARANDFAIAHPQAVAIGIGFLVVVLFAGGLGWFLVSARTAQQAARSSADRRERAVLLQQPPDHGKEIEGQRLHQSGGIRLGEAPEVAGNAIAVVRGEENRTADRVERAERVRSPLARMMPQTIHCDGCGYEEQHKLVTAVRLK